MAEQSTTSTGQELPEQLRRRGQRYFIYTAVGNSIWANSAMMKVSPLFLLALGAQEIHLGLLAGLMQLAWMGQLIGLKLIPRVGKARMVSFGNLITVIPTCVLIGLGFLASKGSLGITIALAGYACMVFSRATGLTGWWPLIQDITEGDPRGAFFTRLRSPLRIVEITLPILIGAYLGTDPSPARFALPFCLGAIAIGVTVFLVRRVPERKLSLPRTNLLLRLRLAGHGKPVRRYLLFVAQFGFTFGLVVPFWIFVLKKQRGLSDQFVLWTAAVGGLGHMAGLRLWGRMVDAHGGRSVLSFAVGGVSVLGLGWLFAPWGGLGLKVWAVGYYFLWGFFFGAYHMGRTYTMVSTIPHAYQADGFTLSLLCMSAASAMGSLIGGVIFRFLLNLNVSVGALPVHILYLCGVQLCALGTLWTRSRMVGFSGQTTARQLMGTAWKNFIARLAASQKSRPW